MQYQVPSPRAEIVSTNNPVNLSDIGLQDGSLTSPSASSSRAGLGTKQKLGLAIGAFAFLAVVIGVSVSVSNTGGADGERVGNSLTMATAVSLSPADIEQPLILDSLKEAFLAALPPTSPTPSRVEVVSVEPSTTGGGGSIVEFRIVYETSQQQAAATDNVDAFDWSATETVLQTQVTQLVTAGNVTLSSGSDPASLTLDEPVTVSTSEQAPSLSSTASPSLTPSVSPTVSDTPSVSVSASTTPSLTAVASPSDTPSNSPTASVSESSTASPSLSSSETSTATHSPTASTSVSPSTSLTRSATGTTSESFTSSVSLSSTASTSESSTTSVSDSATASVSDSSTSTASLTSTATATRTPSPSTSLSSTGSVSVSATASVSHSSSSTISETPSTSLSPTSSVSESSTASISVSPTISVSSTISVSPTNTASISVSPTVTGTPTSSLTPSPSFSPSPSPLPLYAVMADPSHADATAISQISSFMSSTFSSPRMLNPWPTDAEWTSADPLSGVDVLVLPKASSSLPATSAVQTAMSNFMARGGRLVDIGGDYSSGSNWVASVFGFPQAVGSSCLYPISTKEPDTDSVFPSTTLPEELQDTAATCYAPPPASQALYYDSVWMNMQGSGQIFFLGYSFPSTISAHSDWQVLLSTVIDASITPTAVSS